MYSNIIVGIGNVVSGDGFIAGIVTQAQKEGDERHLISYKLATIHNGFGSLTLKENVCTFT